MNFLRKFKNFLFPVEEKDHPCEIVSVIARFNLEPIHPVSIVGVCQIDPDIFGPIDILSIGVRKMYPSGVFGDSKVLTRNYTLTSEYSTNLIDMKLILAGDFEEENECLEIVNKTLNPDL